MRNVEIKARLRDRDRALAVCAEIGAAPQGDLHQMDTYFRVPSGRLKLRDYGDGRAELIHYHRPDVAGAKLSEYEVVPCEPGLAGLLSRALGVVTVVEKTRTLSLWKSVRIHLDLVAGLGDFLEFEAVLGEMDDDAAGQGQIAWLRERFAVRDEDLLSTSYLEMMLGDSG